MYPQRYSSTIATTSGSTSAFASDIRLFGCGDPSDEALASPETPTYQFCIRGSTNGRFRRCELIDYSIRTGAPLEVVENLQAIEDEDGGEVYESIQEIWPDFPTDDDYLWNEEEY